MKVLKNFFIGLLIVIAALVVISFFLPRLVHVERTANINAPASVVFNQINNLKNWGNWSPWEHKDPEMQKTYSGPESGIGATYAWSSEVRDVGKGSMTISESIENEKVVTELDFMENGKATGGFILTEKEGMTHVVWYFETDLGMNPIARYFGLLMEKFVSPDFDAGLVKLKEYCENNNTGSYKIESITTSDMELLSIKITCTPDEISQKMGECYGQIMAYITARQVTMAGMPLAIYYYYSEDSVVMEPAIPVVEKTEGNGSILSTTLLSMNNVLKLNYYGDYHNLGIAHEAMDAHMAANNITQGELVWEIYVTDPGQEPDTSKWLTEVYYQTK